MHRNKAERKHGLGFARRPMQMLLNIINRVNPKRNYAYIMSHTVHITSQKASWYLGLLVESRISRRERSATHLEGGCSSAAASDCICLLIRTGSS